MAEKNSTRRRMTRAEETAVRNDTVGLLVRWLKDGNFGMASANYYANLIDELGRFWVVTLPARQKRG